jgi:hypothetical protein
MQSACHVTAHNCRDFLTTVDSYESHISTVGKLGVKKLSTDVKSSKYQRPKGNYSSLRYSESDLFPKKKKRSILCMQIALDEVDISQLTDEVNTNGFAIIIIIIIIIYYYYYCIYAVLCL